MSKYHVRVMERSRNASLLDPLAQRPEERSRRIAAMRERRYREAPDSDLNILLFAHDEMQKDLAVARSATRK